MSLEDNIAKYILDAEEYPTMYELIEEYSVYKWDAWQQYIFWQALFSVVNSGKIMYDNKHDNWIYTGISNDKLRKLIDSSISLKKNP